MTSWRAVIIAFGVLATCSIAAPLDSQEGQLTPAVWSSTSPNNHGYQRITRYRDNLDYVIDRKMAQQFTPIGELETVAFYKDDRGNDMHYYGTGFLISPCLVATNHHVVFSGESHL